MIVKVILHAQTLSYIKTQFALLKTTLFKWLFKLVIKDQIIISRIIWSLVLSDFHKKIKVSNINIVVGESTGITFRFTFHKYNTNFTNT